MDNPYELYTDEALINLLIHIKLEINDHQHQIKTLIHEHALAYGVVRKRYPETDKNGFPVVPSYPRPQDTGNALESELDE